MADEKPRTLSHKELAELLVKKWDIHEGIWGVYVELALAGLNAGPSDEALSPAALVAIQRIGLQPFPKETGLSVDAAKVNPAAQKSPSATRRKK